MKNLLKSIVVLSLISIVISCSKSDEVFEFDDKSSNYLTQDDLFAGLDFDTDRLEKIDKSLVDPNLESVELNDLTEIQDMLNSAIIRNKSFSGNLHTGRTIQNEGIQKFDLKKINLAARSRGENDGETACGKGKVVVSSSTWGARVDVHIAWSNTGDFKIHSELSGITIGTSYTQSGNARYTELFGTVYYEIYGYVSWNLGIIGGGEYYRERIKITGSYNTCNGDYQVNYY